MPEALVQLQQHLGVSGGWLSRLGYHMCDSGT